jgi:glutamine synthetase
MSLSAYARDKGVKYFLIAFVDLFGTMRAKIVPARRARALPALRPGWTSRRPIPTCW